MTDESEKIVKEWLASDEGKQAIQRTIDESKEVVKKIRSAERADLRFLNIPMCPPDPSMFEEYELAMDEAIQQILRDTSRRDALADDARKRYLYPKE